MNEPGTPADPPDSPDHAPAARAPDPPSASRPRRRRRRRVWIIIGGLIVAFLAVLAAAPYIASTRPAANFVVALINGRVKGTISIETLSLTWVGANEIAGIRVQDPDGREVLRVPRVTQSGGLLKVLTSGFALGEMRVESPSIVLYLNDRNQASIADAFAARRPSPTGSTINPHVRVQLDSGGVRIINARGDAYELSKLNGHLDVTDANDVFAKLAATLARGENVAIETALRRTPSDDRFRLDDASGKLRIQSDREIQLEPLAAVFAPTLGLQGGVRVEKVDVAIEQGVGRGEIAASVVGVQTRDRATVRASPIDVNLKSRLEFSENRAAADVAIDGPAGRFQGKATYAASDGAKSFSFEQLLSTMAAGGSSALPEFAIEAHGTADLVVLGRAVPGLLKLRPGQQIVAGRVDISKIAVRGGDAPVLHAAVNISEVVAESPAGPARLQPVSLAIDAGLREGQELRIDRCELQSSFARIQASGAASELHAAFECDLGKLQDELAQLFDLGSFELAGTAGGTLQAARRDDEHIRVALQIELAGVRYAAGLQRVDIPRGSVRHTGDATIAGRRLQRYDCTTFDADLNGELIVKAAGWYDVSKRALHADLDTSRAELGFLGRHTALPSGNELSRYSGTLSGKASIDRTGDRAPLSSSGAIALRNLSVDGKPLMNGEGRISWNGVEIAPDATGLRAAALQLHSAIASLEMKDARWEKTAHRNALTGRIDASADLRPFLNAVALIARMEKPPAIGGKLNLNAALAAAGSQITVTGRGAIDSFEAGVGEKSVREKSVQLVCDARVDPAARKVALSKFQLGSAPLTAEVSGTIDRYDTDCVLALSGAYDAAWEPLMAVLRELAPDAARIVTLSGRSRNKLSVKGPVRKPGVVPSFRGLDAGTEVSWDRVRAAGIELNAAKLAPKLHDGQLTLPATKITTAGGAAKVAPGAVNLAGAVDFREPDPTIRIPGRVQVLENVPITPELAETLLSRVNPIFLHLARVEGRASLWTQDVSLPLGEAIRRKGAGRGRLDLSTIQIQPGGLIDELLELGGLTDERMYTVRAGAVDLVIRDGRIVYDNFTLIFPENFDLKFRGSVGFDESLDLVVSIPIRASLLERLGVRGAALGLAQKLAHSRVEVPIVGTREQPKLELARVDVEALLKGLLPESPEDVIGELLRQLGEPKKDKPPDRPRKKPPP